MSSLLFTGLSAFPPTPVNEDGVVDADKLSILIQHIVDAGVDSIGLLGSTGIYAYLDRTQRQRAVAVAVEAAAGRVPLIVGVGSLRTNWSEALARDAENAGATGLLLAPMSYTPLTEAEVAYHYRAVASATGLPICVYNNPGTTNFSFSHRLIADLALVPNISAIKMPLPSDGDFTGELSRLRTEAPSSFKVGYSGDWGAVTSLLAGGDAWYSVIAGLLPAQALRMTRAAQAGRGDEALKLNAAFEPLWKLFRAHGSLRVMYEIADRLSLSIGNPPAPLRRINPEHAGSVVNALEELNRLER